MTTRQFFDSQIDECDAVIAAQGSVIREGDLNIVEAEDGKAGN